MPTRRTLVLAGVALLQLAVVLTFVVAGPSDRTHHAPVGLAAPGVVATVLQERAAGTSDVDVVRLASDDAAREAVEDGRVVAAVVVDLRTDRDTFYTASVLGAPLTDAVRARVTTFEGTFGRSLDEVDLVPARSGDADRRGTTALVLAAALLGFAAAVALTWWRGPVAGSARGGVRRTVAVAAAAVLVGLLGAATAHLLHDDRFAAWWLLLALTAGATASTTLALEGLVGVAGIGVSTTLFVVAAGPVATLAHTSMLPRPWDVVTPWLPHGAALDAATSLAYFDGHDVVRPLLLLVGWTVVATGMAVLSRVERQREGV